MMDESLVLFIYQISSAIAAIVFIYENRRVMYILYKLTRRFISNAFLKTKMTLHIFIINYFL